MKVMRMSKVQVTPNKVEVIFEILSEENNSEVNYISLDFDADGARQIGWHMYKAGQTAEALK